MRDRRIANECRSVFVGTVGRLLNGLTLQRVVLRIDGAIAACPEERTVRLRRVEIAEVEAAATASASTTPTAPAKAATTAGSAAEATSAKAAAATLRAAGYLAKLLRLLHVFKIIAELVDVHAGEGITAACLPGHGYRIAGKVGVTGDGRQGSAVSTAESARGTRSKRISGCAQQSEILGPAACELTIIAAVAGPGVLAGVGCLLPGSEDEREILCTRGCRGGMGCTCQRCNCGRSTRWRDDNFLRHRCKGEEIRTQHVAAVTRNRQTVITVDVCGTGEFFAGKRVGCGHSDAWERRWPGFDGAANFCFERGRGRPGGNGRWRRSGSCGGSAFAGGQLRLRRRRLRYCEMGDCRGCQREEQPAIAQTN